jgi:hypothetical protein
VSERQAQDRTGKWLLEHQGRGALAVGGFTHVRSCFAEQAEVVQPRQLPDGLLRVSFVGSKKPVPVVVEIATYPEPRVVEQAQDDLMLVYQDRRVVPEMLILVLRPKGHYEIPRTFELWSDQKRTRLSGEWDVKKVWEVPAKELLELDDVGVVPWLPLTEFDGPPEDLLQECRRRIEGQAPYREVDNLLAVTQVLTRLRFGDREDLLTILGGDRVMIETPFWAEAEEQGVLRGHRAAILRILRMKVTTIPGEIETSLEGIKDEAILGTLLEAAVGCTDLAAFEEAVGHATAERPARRRKRRKGK